MSFLFSQTQASAAVLQIADSIGASGDAEMQARALRSLNHAIRHFNNQQKWNWLWTEAPPAYVYAPFTVSAVTASAGQASAASPTGHGLAVDDLVVGSVFLAGTRVSATAVSGFGLYVAPVGYTGTATADITAIRDMYAAPADLKASFTAKLVGSNNVLRPLHRRLQDRVDESEANTSTPEAYDEFLLWNRGKIRLVPAPGAADVLLVRYHREMATASASASTATLDLPDDYEPYLIAWAKFHFLTDKGEGRKDQATVWHAIGEQGLKTMIRDQVTRPDIAWGFVPGAYEIGAMNDNTTRWIPWTYAGG